MSIFGKAIGNGGHTGLAQPFKREKNGGTTVNYGGLVHFDCSGLGAWAPH